MEGLERVFEGSQMRRWSVQPRRDTEGKARPDGRFVRMLDLMLGAWSWLLGCLVLGAGCWGSWCWAAGLLGGRACL